MLGYCEKQRKEAIMEIILEGTKLPPLPLSTFMVPAENSVKLSHMTTTQL